MTCPTCNGKGTVLDTVETLGQGDSFNVNDDRGSFIRLEIVGIEYHGTTWPAELLARSGALLRDGVSQRVRIVINCRDQSHATPVDEVGPDF